MLPLDFLDIIEQLEDWNALENCTADEKGLAKLFADIHQDYCCYNTTSNCWYVFDGKRWGKDESALIMAKCAKIFAEVILCYVEDAEDEKIVKLAESLGSGHRRESLIKDARDCNFVDSTIFDRKPNYLNCANGTLNLDNYTLQEHNSEDLLSKICHVSYDTKASSKVFEDFMLEVTCHDLDLVRYIQKALGYSLTADTSLEACFILYGSTTRNGKSTLIETISYMLGNEQGYALNMKPQTLALKKIDSQRADGDVARLKGCRFANASEPPKNMSIDSALLKSLTGRDTITARFIYERDFQFIPEFKLFMNTNFLPFVTEDTLFESGRINVIPFNKHFRQDEQDKNLKIKLRTPENLSGILNWCLEGLKLFRQEGLIPPQAVKVATEEYRSSCDKIGQFIAECLDESPRVCLQANTLYDEYKRFCDNSGIHCETKGEFFDMLRKRNLLSKTGTVDGVTKSNVVKGYVIKNSISPLNDENNEDSPRGRSRRRRADSIYYEESRLRRTG